MANRSIRPAWQRNALFEFFASLKLAVVLLAVLIVAAIAGTLYESSFDAKVARTYIYGAPWFNAWLVLLGANLVVSALSRWPWRKHHVAFLVTHLGIITLLTGSLIGRIFGIEGTITLFKGEAPANRLLVDEHQLRVRDSDGMVKAYRAEFIHRQPSAAKPLELGTLASGARMSVVQYASALEGKLNPRPLKEGGAPALHFTIATQMMGQKLEDWLLADDPQHGNFSMGLANISLKRGAPAAGETAVASGKPSAETEIVESIFAFAKAPDEQIAKSLKGGSTGAKVQFVMAANGNKGTLAIDLAGKKSTLDVADNLGKDVPIEGTPFTAHIENYWPDFRIENGKPTSVSDQPNNPAVVVTLRGRAIPVEPPPDAHRGGAPAMTNENDANHLTLFIADDGTISYELASRKNGKASGKLELNKPLATSWADWQLTVDRTLAHAEEWTDFNPSTAPANAKNDLPDGVRVRVQQGNERFEQWVPAGWQISVPVSPQEVQIAYGWKQIPLPIALELLDFEVQRNEGSDSPAGFKSTLRVTTADGESATGQCWMNHPFSFPGQWWRTWSGLTFKMSQASWNPENLNQSTIQILRDPGWLLKWIGSLLIVSGVFMLFYVKKFRRPTAGEKVAVPRSSRPAAVAAASLLLFAALVLLGCASHNTPWTAFATQKHPWGYYVGSVDTRWNPDGRTMTVLNELRYVDPNGHIWIAPAGSVIDGASIPKPLWSFMGGPFEGKYRSASVLHDVCYDQKNRAPQECDRMFYNAMRCSGVGGTEAKTMYWALLHFGWHWKWATKKAQRPNLGEVAAAKFEAGLAARTTPTPPTRETAVNPGDVHAIREWVRKNDPSLEQIEAQASRQ